MSILDRIGILGTAPPIFPSFRVGSGVLEELYSPRDAFSQIAQDTAYLTGPLWGIGEEGRTGGTPKMKSIENAAAPGSMMDGPGGPF